MPKHNRDLSIKLKWGFIMAECAWCGSKGFFLSVDRNKLCKRCQSQIYLEFQQRLRIIQDSQKLIEKSKNFKTRISRIDVLIEHVRALKQYEEKNISTLEPVPSECEKNYLGLKNELIYEDIVSSIEKTMNKAKLGLSAKTKMNEANKAILTIMERRGELQEEDKIKNLKKTEKDIRDFIHQAQLDDYIESAKKAEFKGQKSKALDKYQEALYFLQTDEIDDALQKENIEEIKKKIKELTE